MSVSTRQLHHASGVLLRIQRRGVQRHPLKWVPSTGQTRRTWYDEQDATEHGASAVAILVAFRILGYSVTSRSRKGTGFDYWLGKDQSRPPFAREARLEVSGIRRGSTTDVRRRVNAKKRQMAGGSPSLTGFVIVVEFSKPLARVEAA